MKNSIAIILAIFILIVSFLSFTNTPFVFKTFSAIKSGLSIAVGPALTAISRPVDTVASFFGGYIGLINAGKENKDLRAELNELRMENTRLREYERENKRFKELLGFMEKKPNTMIAARVTGEDLNNWFRCIIVDKGNKQGVRSKMPVITPKGIVGQAVEVDRWHSKVMIINDTNSSIDVSVDNKSTRGLLEGTGRNILKLKYVIKNDPVEIGDKLFTSGKDGIFPKGIPAGIVMTVDKSKAGMFADIDVMPYNNFKELNEVLIIKN
ncbi:MAG TPA: rod shape-determining protein MreC [Syntrophorhabdaceae bacterium]|nr:rod shape-determining protein MreC [Syntrophorhabdaceae bacterium]